MRFLYVALFWVAFMSIVTLVSMVPFWIIELYIKHRERKLNNERIQDYH